MSSFNIHRQGADHSLLQVGGITANLRDTPSLPSRAPTKANRREQSEATLNIKSHQGILIWHKSASENMGRGGKLSWEHEKQSSSGGHIGNHSVSTKEENQASHY